MNRRTFFRVLGLGAIAAPLTTPLAAFVFQASSPYVLTFKGVPIIYDPHCIASRIHFVNTQDGGWDYRLTGFQQVFSKQSDVLPGTPIRSLAPLPGSPDR